MIRPLSDPMALAAPALLLLAGLAFPRCSTPAEEPPGEASGMAGMGMMAHGDHAPRYGGYVFMHGDLHFEVVLGRDGEHRVYFSDAMRSELPAAVAEDVRLTVRRTTEAGEQLEPLSPRIDEFGEAWIASGRPISSEDAVAIVYFRFEGSPYEIEVPFIMEPPTVDPHTGLPIEAPEPAETAPRPE